MIYFLKKFKLWLLGLLIPIAFAATQFGAVTYTEVPSKTETLIGYDATSVFENNLTKEKIKVSITHDEYIALGKKNAVLPEINGYKWIGASEMPIFDISSTILKDNEYAGAGIDNASSSLVRIKRPFENEKIILKTDL